MSMLINGSSVITAGLDHWFEPEDPTNLFLDEFVVPEWRLQERLKVSALRLPPDYRSPRGRGAQHNVKLSVPVLRFPRWCFCIYCKRLFKTTLSMTQLVRCPDETHAGKPKPPIMSQVPFIAICERGHLDDFPFDKWVHRSLMAACPGPLRLLSQGGGTLGGQVVRCDGCKQQRNLEGITQAAGRGTAEERTLLSTQLVPGEEYTCAGSRPWVADEGSGCGLYLWGALRGAGNVYFPKVESSIFLPRRVGGVNAEVLELLRRPDIQPRIQLIHELAGDVTVAQLRQHLAPELLRPFSDQELRDGLGELLGNRSADAADGEQDILTSTAAWRYPEFELLRQMPSHPDLTGSDPGLTGVRLWIGPGGSLSWCPRDPVTLRGCSCGAGRGFALADDPGG